MGYLVTTSANLVIVWRDAGEKTGAQNGRLFWLCGTANSSDDGKVHHAAVNANLGSERVNDRIGNLDFSLK